MSKSLREGSRLDYTSAEPFNLEKLQTGALLRMADATEVMAKNYNALLVQNEQLRESLKFWRESSLSKDRKLNALRGVITKLKKKGVAVEWAPYAKTTLPAMLRQQRHGCRKCWIETPSIEGGRRGSRERRTMANPPSFGKSPPE